MIHKEFLPQVNSESYLEVLEKLLLKQNLQTKLHFQQKGRRLLIHNNPPAHCHKNEVPSGKNHPIHLILHQPTSSFPYSETAHI